MNNLCDVSSFVGNNVKIVLCQTCIDEPPKFVAPAINAIGVLRQVKKSCRWCGAPGIEPEQVAS